MVTTPEQRAANKRYYWNHHPQMLLKNRTYNLTHQSQRALTQQYEAEALFWYALDVFGEHCCLWCQSTDPRCLQFDHKHGHGKGDKSGKCLHLWIITHPLAALEKYQILCANCNWIKRWTNRLLENGGTKHVI